MGALRAQAATSPRRRNRHGVTVPYRVLSDDEVAGTSGYPHPVRPWRSPARGPAGLPRTVPARGSDSASNPLLGFSPPSRPVSNTPPTASRPKAPLLGFLSPTAHQEERVHVPVAGAPRGLPGNPSTGPTPPTTAPLAGFPNLSAASTSLDRPAIFRQVALMGFALQGIDPLVKPRRLVAAGMPS